MKYQLPNLKYSYDALEPYIDVQTMQIHHRKHHQAYVDNLNNVLGKYPNFQKEKLENLLKSLDSLDLDETDKTAIKNNGGGHLNHDLYWEIMGPKKEINRILIGSIENEFGSINRFKEIFTQTAVSHFGSGWAWLVSGSNGKLKVYSLPNQDSPFLLGDTPIIALDLWEHAYYLKYQNRRAEYIKNWWSVLKLI